MKRGLKVVLMAISIQVSVSPVMAEDAVVAKTQGVAVAPGMAGSSISNAEWEIRLRGFSMHHEKATAYKLTSFVVGIMALSAIGSMPKETDKERRTAFLVGICGGVVSTGCWITALIHEQSAVDALKGRITLLERIKGVAALQGAKLH